MILDINKFRLNKPGLLKMYTTMGEPDKRRRLGQIALATHTPLIALHYFVLEELGPDLELEENLEKLMKFYGIKEVIK